MLTNKQTLEGPKFGSYTCFTSTISHFIKEVKVGNKCYYLFIGCFLSFQDREQGTRSLLVVCGDHGMSDQGSHGGSSVPEVMTPLVLIDTQSKLSQGEFIKLISCEVLSFKISIICTLKQ